MADPTTSTGPDPVAAVVVPSGAPLLDAARWVGHVCWAELRFHQVLTGWLALEPDPVLATTLWQIRAGRADLAEAWHRRLPELRELPRAGFVEPSGEAEAGFAALVALEDPQASRARALALAAALEGVQDHYQAHVAVAVGPADGPVAATLAAAVARTEADLGALAAATPAA
ncbi:MAG TPA: hypothetical protein VHK88_05520 [Aquihabitans sp.]|jgi:hypothetical protein|nr:hypothetical protein [Aquihabitans sp.]